MTTTPNLSYSTRPLPAVHGLILDLHVLANAWLSPSGQPRNLTSKVRRAGRNAAVAIELASHGCREKHNVARAKEMMIIALGVFRLLWLEHYLDKSVFDNARHRIDQILAGLDDLSSTPRQEWSNLEPPPREPTRVGPEVSASSTSSIQEIDDRLHAAAGMPRDSEAANTLSATPH